MSLEGCIQKECFPPFIFQTFKPDIKSIGPEVGGKPLCHVIILVKITEKIMIIIEIRPFLP